MPEALSAALVDLRRSEGVVRLRLGGLSTEEIGEFVAARGGRRPGADLPQVARALSELTGGNAVPDDRAVADAVGERDRVGARRAVGALAAALAELGSPEGVREVVSQRLARLSTATTSCSSSPPSPDRSSTFSAVAQSGLAERRALRRRSSEAIAHGMIEEVPSPRLAFRFTHELVRRALYDRMPADPAGRAAPPGRPRRWSRPRSRRTRSGLADLAYHFGGRGPGGRAAPCHRVLAAGGPRGAQTLDFEEAGGPLRLRARARHRRCAPTGRDAARARHRPLPRRWLGRRDGGLPRRRTDRARPRRTRACSRARRSVSRRLAGGRASPTRAPSSCSRKHRWRSGTRTPSFG